jgi:hypothetical protein
LFQDYRADTPRTLFTHISMIFCVILIGGLRTTFRSTERERVLVACRLAGLVYPRLADYAGVK